MSSTILLPMYRPSAYTV